MEIDPENLISLVFARKPLWDKTTKLYRNRLVVDKLWVQVATELGASSDAAKKKWKSLRDTFGKELRKVPEGRSGDEGPLNFETYTTWPYFDSMLFLKSQMRVRKSGGNLSLIGDGNDDIVLVEQQEDVGQESATGSVPDPIEVDSVVYSVADIAPSNPSSRPTKRSAQAQLIEIEAKKLKLLELKANQKPSTDDDEDAAFFKSLLGWCKNMCIKRTCDIRRCWNILYLQYIISLCREISGIRHLAVTNLFPELRHCPALTKVHQEHEH